MYSRLVARLTRVIDAEDREALTEFGVRWGVRLIGGALAVEWVALTLGLAVRVFREAAGWQ